MKRAAALVVLGCAGLLAGQALAATLPPVPVPSVTVPVPPVVVPLPQIPRLPAPVLSAPVQKSSPTGSAPVQVPSLSGSPFSSGGSSQSSSGSSSGSSRSSAQRPKIKHLRSSRTWIGTSGKKNRRVTTLTFVLDRAARVVFTVRQLSPDCGTVGRFTVRGHTGLNRVRFAGRVRGQQLGAGTYRITARTAAGRAVQRVLIVVVDGPAPTRAELVALRSSNVCSATRGTASTASSSSGALSGTEPEQVQRPFSPKEQPSALGPSTGASSGASGGVLASTVERTARAIRPVLVVLLALSILLLGLAALPQVAVPDPRFNDVLARHRLEIAGVGTAALLAVVITFLLG